MITPGVRYMLVSTFAFALMQVCVKLLPGIPAHEIIFFRSLISLSFCYSFLKYYKIPVLGNNRKVLILRGVFGVAALTLFFITIKHIPLASAVTLQLLSPVFTAFFAQYILREKVKRLQWLFFLVAFIGVALIKGFDDRVSVFYLVIGVLSAAFAGLAYNCIRKVKDTDHPLVVVMYFPLITIPIMGTYCLVEWVQPNWMELILLIMVGSFTQIGQVYMTRALQAEKANRVTAFKYLGTPYALLFGFIIFGEIFSGMSLLGIGLVVSGVLLNTWHTSARKASLNGQD